MVAWTPIIMGGFSAAQSLLGSYSKRQQQKAKNRAAIKRFHRRVDTQKRHWYNTLAIWNNKSKTTAPLSLDFATAAARRGEAQAQQGLNALMYDTALKNNKLVREYLEKSPGVAGQKSQGASSNRRARLDYGAMLSKQFENSYVTDMRGREAFSRNREDIWNKFESDRRRINTSVMFQPQTPPPVEFDPDSLGQESLGPLDFASSALSFVDSFKKWSPE